LIKENDEERIVREYFENRNYLATKLDSGSTEKRPDYLIEKGEIRFLVEVKNIEEQTEFISGSKVVNKIKNILNKMKLDFGLSFRVYDDVQEQDLKKRQIEGIVRNRLSSPGTKIGDEFELTRKIQFKVKDIVSKNSKAFHIGIYGLAKKVDTADRIREDIKGAVEKYKSFHKNLPYVLMLFSKRIIFDNDDLLAGMFGDITAHISKDSYEVVGLSRKDSALQSQKNTSISAVAIYKDNYFEIYHNPYKAIELPYEIFEHNRNIQYYVDSKTGEFISK